MLDKQSKSDHQIQPIEPFLPDLCRGQGLLAIVVIAQLLAILVVIASKGLITFDWVALGKVSFLAMWIALLSAMFLCLTRHFYSRAGHMMAAILSFFTILLTTILCAAIGQWVEGIWSGHYRFDLWKISEISLLAAIPAAILLRYLYLEQQLRIKQQTELESRIQALQSRIRPHFLFNSMNMIASLIGSDPDRAERVVEDLSELFRYALSDSQVLVKLADELSLTKRYVELEKLRMGSRLRVVWQIESYASEVIIPCLTLQPILENAIYHGIQTLAEGGLITVKVSQSDNRINIEVRNPYTAAMKHHKGNNIALDNIHRRLQSHFGRSADIKTVDKGEDYVTCISYPVSR
jgi:two-component system sensor histidine kinase AlgZ